MTSDNLYWTDIDESAPNNAHVVSLGLVGQNKRVLELGAAAGHITRMLVQNGCRVVCIEYDSDAAQGLVDVAERVIVGDLSAPGVIAGAIDDERFDVVLAGDVLEHLPDPLTVLRACRDALKPGGYVVMSLPNIAHADVKLQLMEGHFPYQDTGLLDRTHLHFFTRDSIDEMVHAAGLLTIDLERTLAPVFTSEQAVDRASVSDDVLKAVLADPESETYQFVVRAVVHDGDAEVAQLGDRVVSLTEDLRRERAHRVELEAELEQALQELEQAVEQKAQADIVTAEHQARVVELETSTSWKITAPLRALFRRS